MMSDRLRNVLVCKSWSCEFHLQLDVGASEIVASWCFRASPPLRGFRCCFCSYCARELVTHQKQGEWKNVVGWKDSVFNDLIRHKWTLLAVFVSPCSL